MMVESQGLVAALPADAGGSNRELIDQARAGRREAHETLARRHHQAAFLLALQMLGNRDDAMNVAREQALNRMVDEARGLGATAIVSLRFSTSMIMGGAAELLAYGTAVVLEDEIATASRR